MSFRFFHVVSRLQFASTNQVICLEEVLASVKSLAGKIVDKMTYIVSSEMLCLTV